MKVDFTISKYIELLNTMINAGYSFQTFDQFISNPEKKSIVLRHDVDLLPNNSLKFAIIQHEYNVVGSYYFRAVPESWDEKIICKIAAMGHEVGYHYENLTTTKGNLEKGIEDFKENLDKLRKFVPVSTICMHGSPMSKYDSKDLWKEYNYKDYQLKGEPYFDIDFNKVLYLTDTGRRWDGRNVSIRDKVNTIFSQNYRSTDQLIHAFNNMELPNQIMFTFHPQRWHEDSISWLKELGYQNFKNLVKKYLLFLIQK